MKTQRTFAARMSAAGVPETEAHWYFNVARPRGFSAPGDAARAARILRMTCAVTH